MKITRGVIIKAQKVIVYGPEGIGKSSFASDFPDPLFIDTEGSTNLLSVARMDKPSSWTMLLNQIKYIVNNSECCRSLVIDTIDWAEQLCIESICAAHQKKGIEEFGYGTGYVYVREEFGRMLNLLSDVIEKGINVVLTAHTQIRKFEQPNEMGSYDRYELKLGKKTSSQTAPLVKEWADMVLFANYKVFAVEVNNKMKAQGGQRVMYTTHHPNWDAKNRHDLKSELPFEFKYIASCIPNNKEINTESLVEPAPKKEPVAAPIATKIPQQEESVVSNIPKALADLMVASSVTEFDIQNVVAQKGYFPIDTPIAKYPEDFIKAVLVGAWEQVYKAILLNKEVPF